MCITPISLVGAGGSMTLKDGSTRFFEDGLEVKCGKCWECRKEYRLQWRFRLEYENKISFSSYFVTLTYDNEHIPYDENGIMCFNKHHLKMFWKKLRRKTKKRFGDDHKISYWIVSEFGGKTLRPHYHAIIYNCSYYDISDSWSYGDNVDIGTVTAKSINYCTAYMDGKVFNSNYTEPEYSMKSNGLGMDYLTPSMIKYHRDNEIYHLVLDDGTCVAMPKIYRERIWNELERSLIADEMKDNYELRREKLIKEFEDNYKFDGYEMAKRSFDDKQERSRNKNYIRTKKKL